MKIKELSRHIRVLKAVGDLSDAQVKGVTDDSREVADGVVFVASPGPLQDGHRYILEAIRKGALAVVLSDEAFLPASACGVPHFLVADPRMALSRLCDVFFGYPYQHIKCIGVTGTNGKTTVSYLVRNILKTAGVPCGLIGTIGYRVAEENLPIGNTTPGTVELHRMVREMVLAGDRCVVMEVSSHALDQGRIVGLTFAEAVFTNLTQDHLDYHGTMEEYFAAKVKLFKEHADVKTHAIVNRDDPFGARLLGSLRGKKISYGFSQEADVHVVRYELGKDGSRAQIKTPSGAFDISTRLVGKHNLYNILAAVGLGVCETIDLETIRRGIEELACVPGRLDRIDSPKGFSVFVDYAHTDDALKNVLESLAAIAHNGRIITVFGCGGDRDRGKRPKMGAVASSLSDHCIITSDNPRSEDPKEIIREIESGITKKNFEIEEDRFLAIQKALRLARPGDLVLVAGKGHESYQIVKDKVLAFDDKETVLKILQASR